VIAGARASLLGALVGVLPVLVVASALDGARAAGVTALAAVIVVVQFLVGLPVEWWGLRRADLTGMSLVLAAYAVRLALLGGLLWLVLAWNAGAVPVLWVALGAAVTTFGWIGGMAWNARHGRVLLAEEVRA